MTQLGIGVAALNQESSFQAAYEKGIKKSEYWEYTLDDSLKLIARLPVIAARIYRNVYRQGSDIPAIDKDLDLVGKTAQASLLLHLIALKRQLFAPAWLWRQSGPHGIPSLVYCASW
jgi:hypothetical protein